MKIEKEKANELFQLVYDFSNEVKRQDIRAYASSIAFFIFLSLMPLVVLVCAILPYTPLKEPVLVHYLTSFSPDLFDDLITSVIDSVYESNAGIITVSALFLVWSAGQGIMAMIQGLNRVYEVEEKRNYFVIRLVSCFYLIMILVAVLLSLLVMVFGAYIADWLISLLPALAFIKIVILRPRYLYLFLILTLIFSVLFMLLPNKRLAFLEQIPGAMISSVGWIGFSFFYSIYVKLSSSFTVYGSLTMVVIGLLWLYICMYLVLIGAFLNSYFHGITMFLVYRKEKRIRMIKQLYSVEPLKPGDAFLMQFMHRKLHISEADFPDFCVHIQSADADRMGEDEAFTQTTDE